MGTAYNLEEEDISNQYQWGSPDMVNIHLTKEDIEELSYIWSTESKEIIDTINSRLSVIFIFRKKI